MKTVVIQSYRRRDIPRWISRCLASVEAWARGQGYDYSLTGDEVFALCGDQYLGAVGDNKMSIINLARLELIRTAHQHGYDCAVWMDADILIFAPEMLRLPRATRLTFARETWLAPKEHGWSVRRTLNNCVVICPRDDPDLDFVIDAIRHRARHHEVRHNFEVGVDLVRGLHKFLRFPLLSEVGMLSNHIVAALAEGPIGAIGLQAKSHGVPIFAANLCASEHFDPPVPEALALAAMDRLEHTRGGVLNDHLENRHR